MSLPKSKAQIGRARYEEFFACGGLFCLSGLFWGFLRLQFVVGLALVWFLAFP
ncbi:hypothetical protein [Paraburkholderia dilworthii]|uniref:hypothetical protein n=1 Tax=Paraburkholderia dilworthii TaxID=948106 RepID=UPI0012B51D7D|nr:hypothetical protein [Paraburkholderia dilworthii]